jgi:hypothetical protein
MELPSGMLCLPHLLSAAHGREDSVCVEKNSDAATAFLPYRSLFACTGRKFVTTLKIKINMKFSIVHYQCLKPNFPYLPGGGQT